MRVVYRPGPAVSKALSLAPTEGPVFLQGFQVIRGLLGNWWCRKMHGTPMWPIHGFYVCRICLRSFPLDWGKKIKEVKENG